MGLIGKAAAPRYEMRTVDGDVMPITLRTFFHDNSDMRETGEAADIRRAVRNVGGKYRGGGGASPEWWIRRVS